MDYTHSLAINHNTKCGSSPYYYSQFRGHILSSLLLGNNLLITDTQIARGRNFLTAICENDSQSILFRNLLSRCNITVACRKQGNNTLPKLLNRQVELGYSNVNNLKQKCAILEQFQESITTINWEYNDLAVAFDSGIRKYITDGAYNISNGDSKSSDLLNEINIFLKNRRGERQFRDARKTIPMIGLDIFTESNQLRTHLKNRKFILSRIEWKQIRDAANAAYLSGIPELYRTENIINPNQESILSNIYTELKSIRVANVDKNPITFPLPLSLVEFSEGLNALQIEDVLELLDSEEYNTYKNLKTLAKVASPSEERIKIAAIDYLRAICARIAYRLGFSKHRSADDIYKAHLARKTVVGSKLIIKTIIDYALPTPVGMIGSHAAEFLINMSMLVSAKIEFPSYADSVASQAALNLQNIESPILRRHLTCKTE